MGLQSLERQGPLGEDRYECRRSRFDYIRGAIVEGRERQFLALIKSKRDRRVGSMSGRRRVTLSNYLKIFVRIVDKSDEKSETPNDRGANDGFLVVE